MATVYYPDPGKAEPITGEKKLCLCTLGYSNISLDQKIPYEV